MLKIDGSLARNIGCKAANFGVHENSLENVDFVAIQSVQIEEVSYEMLVLKLLHVFSRVFGFVLASPCPAGKLQNLAF